MIYDFHPFETKPDIFRNTGLFTGRGLFETILYEDSVFWFLERHLSRLKKAAAYFEFSRIPEEFYFDRLDTFLRKKQIHSARIKLILLDNGSDNNHAPYFFQIVPYQRQDTDREIACVTVSHPVSDPIFRQYKTINFGAYFHAIKRVDREKEPIFTENDYLLESPIANIFACKNHQLYTPPLKDGILPGIIRSLLMEFLPVEEKRISLNEIHQYDFFIATNSIREIRFIASINEHHFQKTHFWDEIQKLFHEIKQKYQKGELS